MSSVEVHLALNHLPVAGLLLALPMLLVALVSRSRDIALIAMAVIVVAAAVAIPVYFSGEGAEDVLEDLGASRRTIHEHEEAAESSFVVIEVTGIAALVAMLIVWKYARFERKATAAILLFTLIAAVMIGWTAKLGGDIRHHDELSGRQSNEARPVADED